MLSQYLMPTLKETIRHDSGNLLMNAEAILTSFGQTTNPAEEARLMQLVAVDGRQLIALAERYFEACGTGCNYTNLFDLAQRAVHRVAHYAHWEDFAIELSEPVVIAVPKDIVDSVVDNLIDNAHKYSPRGSRLLLKTRRLIERVAELRVIDQGCGVPPGKREAIFQRHRLSQHRDQPGTGFGLAISRQALRKHHGDLFHLPNLPHGSQFVARLPIAIG